MKHLAGYFIDYPIIPAVRDIRDLKKVFQLEKSVLIFLLTGSIFDLENAMELAHENDKILMVNIDLVAGIAHDKKGIEYLAENNLCDGIISTKSYLIKRAADFGLMTVQRVFLLDSASLDSAFNSLDPRKIDAVEILPGIAAPYFIEKQKEIRADYPVIAGGLIKYRSEIEKLRAEGVFAVSTSSEELWNYSRE